MGNRLSRRREAPANGAETAATEQKAAEEPVATQQAEAPQIQQVVEAEKPAVVVEEAAVIEPVVESVPEPEAPATSAPLDVTPEPVAEEALAPPPPVKLEPEAEPLVSVSELPAPEPVVEPEPIPEPVVEPEPIPEPVVEPEPTPEPVVEPELVVVPEPIPEPILETEPVPTLEQEIDLLTQVSLPEPLISSAPLVDLGVPDLTPSPVPAIPDEPADLPGVQECHGIIEAAVNSMLMPEESKESWESLEKPLEPESVGAGNVEQLLCDVNSEVTDSGLLKHMDLTGNGRVDDLIPNDIKIPDDIPIADMSGSNELL